MKDFIILELSKIREGLFYEVKGYRGYIQSNIPLKNIVIFSDDNEKGVLAYITRCCVDIYGRPCGEHKEVFIYSKPPVYHEPGNWSTEMHSSEDHSYWAIEIPPHIVSKHLGSLDPKRLYPVKVMFTDNNNKFLTETQMISL